MVKKLCRYVLLFLRNQFTNTRTENTKILYRKSHAGHLCTFVSQASLGKSMFSELKIDNVGIGIRPVESEKSLKIHKLLKNVEI